MLIMQTDRLALREVQVDDAGFILALINDPDWIRFIGNKGIHSEQLARDYIRQGPQQMYLRHGFGLWLVSDRLSRTPMGMCGLIKRDSLEDVDLGFAFMPAFRGQGIAEEAARACMTFARQQLGMQRLVAITTPDNIASGRLLERLGFVLEGMQPGENGQPLKLFAISL